MYSAFCTVLLGVICAFGLIPADNTRGEDPASSLSMPGMPAVTDPANIYSEAGANRLSPAVASAFSRVYVPNIGSGDVYVIDPSTFQVVDRFRVGGNPQQPTPMYLGTDGGIGGRCAPTARLGRTRSRYR